MKIIFLFLALSIFLIIPDGEMDTVPCRCLVTPTDQYGNNKTLWGYGYEQYSIFPCCDDITVWGRVEPLCNYTAGFFLDMEKEFPKYDWVNWQMVWYGNAIGNPKDGNVTSQHGTNESAYSQIFSTMATMYSSRSNMRVYACHFQNVPNDTVSNDTIKKCMDDNGVNSADVYRMADSDYGVDAWQKAKDMTDQMYNASGTPVFRINDIRTENDQQNYALRQNFSMLFYDMLKANHSKQECQQSKYGVDDS